MPKSNEEKKICIFKTGEPLAPVKEAYGDFDSWIARCLGVPADDLDVLSLHEGDPLPAAETVASVIVTGSPAMVTAAPEWSEAAGRWLADAVRSDALPILGICYGHQLMAHGLGGKVEDNPNGREMGTVELAAGPPPGKSHEIVSAGRYPVHMSHFESVLILPSGARVLAKTAIEPHAALQFGPRQWGVQFHPEFDRSITQSYVEARREILEQEGFDPAAMIAGTTEAPESARVITRFGAFTRS